MNDAASRRRLAGAGAYPQGLENVVIQVLSHPLSGDIALTTPEGLPISAAVVRHEDTAVGAILRIRDPHANRTLRKPVTGASVRYDFGQILGESRILAETVRLAKAAALNELPVILSGESGTGKELFAQSIHAFSNRRAGPFVALNCGSIPAQLIEAELFGYEAGAFTDAKREGRIGRCETAHGGTLFLDEVSELPPPAQVALLRVLQEREIVRLGGSLPRMVDVRVIAATNKPLKEEILARRFREDLYYRLNVLTIPVPPLRERKTDIPLLANVFLAEAETQLGRGKLQFGPGVMETLCGYAWPGNIRELKNMVLRAAAMAPQLVITTGDFILDGRIQESKRGTAGDSGRTFGREELVAAIEACHWNLTRAAQQLGISRVTLYRLLRRHAISRDPSAR